MLKKARLKIAAWSITGVIGAGSLFSGIAAQNVYAQEDAAVGSVNENTVDSGSTEISDQKNDIQDSYSDITADTLQSDSVTEDNEGNNPSESPEQNSSDIEKGTEEEKSEDSSQESTTGSDAQNDDNDNAKDFSGTGATKDTKAVQAKKNGWVKVKGGYKYYKNGKAYTGWHKMGKAEGEKTEHYSYFGKDGIVRTGWQSMGKGTKNSYGEKTAKHMCYFGKDGWLRTGWQSMGKGTKNSYKENTAKHMSYFGKDGWLRTGWQSMGKGTKNSYRENTAKHMSYFGKDGWLRTGWQSMGKGTKNSYGENTKKHMSYFGKDGWLRTGWQSMGKGTKNSYNENTAKHMSYFGKDGWLRTGLQSMGKGTKNSYNENSKKHKSYFGNDGWLRVSQKVTVNGKKYKADGRGWLSVFHEENDVLMKYLKKIYNGASYYHQGYPCHLSSGYIYKKYAIADINGDNKNDLIIYKRTMQAPNGEYYYDDKRGYGFFELFTVDSSGNINENPYKGLLHQDSSFSDTKIEFFNNGVLKIKEKLVRHNEYILFDEYIPFNKTIRTSLKANKKNGKDYSPYNYYYEYGTFSETGSGKTLYGYYCGLTGGHDDLNAYSMTKTEYDKELKLLTSGKKINVTWKDFTSKNIK